MLLENKHPGLQFRHLSPRKGGELMFPYKVLPTLSTARWNCVVSSDANCKLGHKHAIENVPSKKCTFFVWMCANKNCSCSCYCADLSKTSGIDSCWYQRLFVERPQFLILVISEFFLKQKKWVLAIMPKISEISVWIQMERSVSVSSHRNIRDGITSGCGPLISVGIFRPKFAVPFLTNRFFALMRKFGKGIKKDPFLLVGQV